MSTTTACPDNLRESILTWTMGAGGHTSTDISVSYDNRHPEVVGELFGSLRLDEGGECGAAVEWTISHQRTHLSSVLTAAEPESRSLDHYSIPDQGVRQIRVDLRRLDARPCQAAVVWDHASFKRPCRGAVGSTGITVSAPLAAPVRPTAPAGPVVAEIVIRRPRLCGTATWPPSRRRWAMAGAAGRPWWTATVDRQGLMSRLQLRKVQHSSERTA